MDPVKVVVAGPFGAGKTTFIRAISDITVLSTEQDISDASEFDGKHQTTVGIDFGRITLADDLVIYLFGTPGQERFDFMWETASRGMLGFILLADAARPESLADAASILDFFRTAESGVRPDREMPFVVAVNKGAGTDAEIEHAAQSLGVDTGRVVAVDARDRDSVKRALVTFLESLLEDAPEPVAV